MMKPLSILHAALLTLGAGLIHLSNATEADEPAPKKNVRATGDELEFNGSAIRTALGHKVYQVGLYVTGPSKDETVILAERNKKRIQIKMLREVSGKRFESTVRKNIVNNYSADEQKKYSELNERFLDCFADRILAKDRIVDIDFIPGEGTEVLIDRKRIDLIPR